VELSTAFLFSKRFQMFFNALVTPDILIHQNHIFGLFQEISEKNENFIWLLKNLCYIIDIVNDDYETKPIWR
jgi:hypothetical protein